MKSNIKKNLVYQVFYQVLVSILPFITSPYISRVIGAEGIGIYSYTYSIMHYFSMVGNLGIGIYGNRLIARTRDKKEEMNKAFSSLFALHLSLYCIVIAAYVVYATLINKTYVVYTWIQLIYLVGYALDISWLFFGLEKFKLTVTRNTIIKIGTVVSVFLFVKSGDDLWKYVLILAFGTFLGQFILWSFFRKYAHFARFKLSEMFVHLKPMCLLLFASIAVSIFSYMDKIMIVALSTTAELGYYENAWKMIEFPTGFITALGTVMLPRISNLQASGDVEKIRQYIYKSLRLSVIAAFAILFGLLAIADDFSVVFWGANFLRCGLLMKIMSIAVLLMAWNNVIRQEVIIPRQKDNIYLLSVVAGAIMNVILNAILIPSYGSAGAAVGTVGAYGSIFIIQTIFVHENLYYKKVFKESIPYFLIGALMMCVVMLFTSTHERNVLNLVVEVVIGVAVIGIATLAYAYVKKDRLILDGVGSVINKIKPKKTESE